MLEASRRQIVERLPDDALVLDVGGWAKPFARANWVIDLLPYETRGLYGSEAEPGEPERFSAETWVRADICAREPWPWADDTFDFVTCSHTLEDVRDPVWVCSELERVARAGYIEVPSRLEEQAFGIQGPWAGWGHHHWLCEVDADAGRIEFTFKHHILHGRPEMQISGAFHATLTEQQRVERLWWNGTLTAEERIFIGPGELDSWLAEPVQKHAARTSAVEPRPAALRRLFRRR